MQMNRLFRRTFSSAAHVKVSKTFAGLSIIGGGGAFAGLAGTVLMFSGQIQDLEIQVAKQNRQLKEGEEERQRMTKKSDREREELEGVVSEKEGLIADQEETIRTKSLDLEQTATSLESTQNQLNSQQRSYQVLQRQAGKLQTEQADLKSSLSSCTTTRRSKETALQRAYRERAELEEEVNALRAKIAAMAPPKETEL